jgi:hypothetical protein
VSVRSVSPPPSLPRARAAAGLALLIAITLAVPFAIPLVNRWRGEKPLPPTYLPALEGPRERGRFADVRITELRGLQPGYVVIGDSMAGTRIDERRLSELTGVSVAPLLQAGSGPAFWYLALKNWVIASGIQPRMVFVFFRDTNLTDVMFRLDEQFRWSLDLVANDTESELNAVVATRVGMLQRVHRFLDDHVGVERARLAAEPAVTMWPAELMMTSRRRRTDFLHALNARLGFDHLRRMQAADIQVTEAPGADFHEDVDRSVLPLMLRDAKAAGLTLCFVRVQRRPTANRPPPQSASLKAYVKDLREYVTARGALFHDDTGDPALTIDMYEDGDHLARHARRRYTENLYNRLRSHFQ